MEVGDNGSRLLERFTYYDIVFYHVYSAFKEVPQSQQVSIGDTATFRCRHASADVIRWRVDHVFVSANPSTDITPDTVREGNHIVHTLTIVARQEYDGTEVECVARFDDHSPDEQTSPAILHILGMINAYRNYVYTCMYMYPCCVQQQYINGTFSLSLSLSISSSSLSVYLSFSPLSLFSSPPSFLSTVVMDDILGQFTEVPLSLNLTNGETAVFVCRHPIADHISWNITPSGHYEQFEPTTIGGVYMLRAYLRDGVDYNGTIIQCRALFNDDLTLLIITEPAILQVQGMFTQFTYNVHVFYM